MSSLNLKIEKASIFDMNKIVKMAFDYHKKDPKVQEILSNPMKSFFYRILGPLYMSLKWENFKATIADRIVGYLVLEIRVISVHVHFIGVHPDYRGQGIGTSLMKFAESLARSKYPYLTLDVMENNTPALKLYKRLGYVNLQDYGICFRLRKIPAPIIARHEIKLETVSGEKAILCRNKYFLNAVEAVSGSDGREIASKVHLSLKLARGIDRYEVVISNREAGYVYVEHKKDLTSIFFILHPDFWGTNTEVEIIDTIIEYVSKLSKGQIEILVMQAYEKSLESSFKKIGLIFDRVVPRLGLVKKLK